MPTTSLEPRSFKRGPGGDRVWRRSQGQGHWRRSVSIEGEALRFGHTVLTALATPGHTDGCTSYVLPGAVFTGDALFIRGNGRTDLQGGFAEKLFDSVRKKLFALPDDTVVYPGHDYQGRISSTIEEEKQFNERLNLSINKETFVEMMNRRNSPRPAKMDIASPANMQADRMV